MTSLIGCLGRNSTGVSTPYRAPRPLAGSAVGTSAAIQDHCGESANFAGTTQESQELEGIALEVMDRLNV
jgi:hypothetical protein